MISKPQYKSHFVVEMSTLKHMTIWLQALVNGPHVEMFEIHAKIVEEEASPFESLDRVPAEVVLTHSPDEASNGEAIETYELLSMALRDFAPCHLVRGSCDKWQQVNNREWKHRGQIASDVFDDTWFQVQELDHDAT